MLKDYATWKKFEVVVIGYLVKNFGLFFSDGHKAFFFSKFYRLDFFHSDCFEFLAPNFPVTPEEVFRHHFFHFSCFQFRKSYFITFFSAEDIVIFQVMGIFLQRITHFYLPRKLCVLIHDCLQSHFTDGWGFCMHIFPSPY